MSSGKQYGLTITKKSSSTTSGLVKKHAAFGDGSDSGAESDGKDWLRKTLTRGVDKTLQSRQAKMDMQRALEQDATVYQYDEIYDQMEKEKEEKTGSSKSKERKPKYIQGLLANAEKRKVENERRIERQVQKEREAEGDEFADKEVFVTSAYKKKLEEFAKLDAEQKHQDMLEEIGDVTKQQDISGIYRHLYQTTVTGETSKSPSEPSKKPADEPSKPKESSSKEKATRQYRKRKSSDSSDDQHQDSDTDVGSSSSSSSGSDSEEEEAKPKEESSQSKKPKQETKKEESSPTKNREMPVTAVTKDDEGKVEEKLEAPQRSVWEKRTVGEVFEAALQRYYERKAQRLGGSR